MYTVITELLRRILQILGRHLLDSVQGFAGIRRIDERRRRKQPDYPELL